MRFLHSHNELANVFGSTKSGRYMLSLMSGVLIFASQVTLAQEDETDESELTDESSIPATPIEEVVTTGSRLQQNPGEIAGQLIVLDEDAIRASGEATLERVLRQLPQNLDPTTEKFGSDLNTASNLTGASTVNLRGLGSESTLILVDGKRIGYNGLMGGVTDVSSIPLSSVERIEIVLDGASAVYGSDAVGGVVNIITRKDYEGIELDVSYDWPGQGGFTETRVGLTASQAFDGWQLKGSYQRSNHSGLDAKDRDVTIIQQSTFPGPSFDIRRCCLGDGSQLAILYQLDGQLLKLAEYNALSDADKARATAVYDAILPDGFNENSDISSITELVAPNWGPQTQEGWHVLPERVSDSFAFGVTKDITDWISVFAQIRGELRDVTNLRGYQALTGQTLGARNPYNPIEGFVNLRGQLRDLPRPYTQTESDILDMSIDFSGKISENFDWEFSLGTNSEDATTLRYNPMDTSTLNAGLRSDGVTPSFSYLSGETAASCAAKGGFFTFGLCRITLPPPTPINPWGDLSNLLGDSLLATSENTQTRIDGLVRGELFELPGGTVRALFGFSQNTISLETSTQFQIGVVDRTPVGDITDFHTDTERKNSAFFAEMAIPLIDEENGVAGVHALHASLSWREDDYDAPSVTYIEADGNTSPEGLPAPGAQDSWGAGLVYSPFEDARIKLSYQSAFVAPQLNQLLRATQRGLSAPFRGILLQQPDGSLLFKQVLVIEGGNADLKPETADTMSAALEYSPFWIPGLHLKATYSEVDYMNRINQLSFFIIDPNNLPTNTTYIAEDDMYVQERRWINVSSVVRQGVDLELIYARQLPLGDMNLHLKRSVINKYEYVLDPNIKDDDASEPISVVGRTEGSTVLGVLPESSMNGTFSWSHRGFDVSVDYQTRSKTVSNLAGITTIYKPLSQFDLTLSYRMQDDAWFGAPDFMKDAIITFYANNVQDKLGRTEILVDRTLEQVEQTYPDSSPIYGRFLGLSVKVPLGMPF